MIAKTNVEQPARGLSRAGNSALSVVSRTPTHIIATQGDLEIVIWRGSTTLDAVETIRTSLGELTRSYPKGIGVLQVVEVTAPPPDAAARNALSNVLRGAGKAVRGSAIVFEGTGFKMAAVRAIVTGLTMLARPEFPHVVFADLHEASAWVAAYLSGAGSGRDVTIWSAVSELRDIAARASA